MKLWKIFQAKEEEEEGFQPPYILHCLFCLTFNDMGSKMNAVIQHHPSQVSA